MKKQLLFFSLLFMAASCSKSEVDQPTQGTTSEPIVLSASTAEGTRVGFEDQDGMGVKVTWAENDELSFYDAEGQLVGDFRLLEGSGKTSAKFEQVGQFSLTEGAKYTVVYPKVAGATSLALYNRILSVQTQDGNAPMSHMDKLMRMEQKAYVYTKTTPAPILFSHSYAMMTLTLDTPENYVAGADGTPKEMILYVGGKMYNLTLTNIAWDSAIKAYVMIEPTSSAGKVRVEVIMTTDKVYTASFDASKAYAAGTRYAKTLMPTFVESYTLATIGNLPTTATTVVVTDAIDETMDLSALKAALSALQRSSPLILPNATGIGANAFDSCLKLTSVSLPAAVTIGDSAFANCTYLTAASLPAAVTIGNQAFLNCNKLTSVNLPAATTIGTYSFQNCYALTSVSMPLVLQIKEGVFETCRALNSVSLPAATVIGDYAFNGCQSLPSVSLPVAEKIGQSAFKACSNLTAVSLPLVTTIGGSAFFECGGLTSVNFSLAATIGDKAFQATSLVSVSFPEAKTIGNQAFSGIPLVSLNLPEATTIGIGAFSGCTSLTSLNLPKAKTIGMEAFLGCTTLTSVSLPMAGVIKAVAFQNCSALTFVNIPKVYLIERAAFASIGTAASVTTGTITFATETTDDIAGEIDFLFGSPTSKYNLEVGPGVTRLDVKNKTWQIIPTATYTFKSITVIN